MINPVKVGASDNNSRAHNQRFEKGEPASITYNAEHDETDNQRFEKGEPASITYNAEHYKLGNQRFKGGQPAFVLTVEERVQALLDKVKIAHYSKDRPNIIRNQDRGRAQRLQNLHERLYSCEHNLEGTTLDNVPLLNIINEIIQHGKDKYGAIDKPIFRVVSELIKKKDISEQGLKTLDLRTMEKIKKNLIHW